LAAKSNKGYIILYKLIKQANQTTTRYRVLRGLFARVELLGSNWTHDILRGMGVKAAGNIHAVHRWKTLTDEMIS